jgi:FtsZ-binding cell division protein ZapB
MGITLSRNFISQLKRRQAGDRPPALRAWSKQKAADVKYRRPSAARTLPINYTITYTLSVTKLERRAARSEHFMALFGGRASMLEVQNRALIKIAGERAQRISELERELQQAVQTVERLQAEVKRLEADAERLKLEREAYHKTALALEQDVRVVSEAAAKYSLWGQTLVRELGKLDPAGQREREFGIWSETLKGR